MLPGRPVDDILQLKNVVAGLKFFIKKFKMTKFSVAICDLRQRYYRIQERICILITLFDHVSLKNSLFTKLLILIKIWLKWL